MGVCLALQERLYIVSDFGAVRLRVCRCEDKHRACHGEIGRHKRTGDSRRLADGQ